MSDTYLEEVKSALIDLCIFKGIVYIHLYAT